MLYAKGLAFLCLAWSPCETGPLAKPPDSSNWCLEMRTPLSSVQERSHSSNYRPKAEDDLGTVVLSDDRCGQSSSFLRHLHLSPLVSTERDWLL